MVIGVAELLRDRRETAERVAHLELVAHAHAAVQLDRFLADAPAGVGDAHLRRRHRARARRGSRSESTAAQARHAIDFTCSCSIARSTIRCCSAWKRADRHAELLARLEVVERRVVGGLDRTDGLGADQRGREIDDVLDQRQRAARRADRGIARYANSVEARRRPRACRRASAAACASTARRAALDDRRG